MEQLFFAVGLGVVSTLFVEKVLKNHDEIRIHNWTLYRSKQKKRGNRNGIVSLENGHTMNSRKAFQKSGHDVDLVDKTILIDMDNTIANFDKEFARRWLIRRPEDDPDIILKRQLFELEYNFPEDERKLRELAMDIMGTSGFYIKFEPMEDCVAAIKSMVHDYGLNVLFCTAPHPLQYESCVSEKYAWVRQHFGEDYLRRIIVTRDKTLIKARALIDDNPVIVGGCANPEWTHVLFSQSYNLKHDAAEINSEILKDQVQLTSSELNGFDTRTEYPKKSLDMCLQCDSQIHDDGKHKCVYRLNSWSEWKQILEPLVPALQQ